MDTELAATEQTPAAPKRRNRWKLAAAMAGVVLLVYLVSAYILLPLGWKRYEKRHPWLDDVPGVTRTKDGIPGDPLNVALVGSEAEIRAILSAARWHAADPLGVRSDLRIAADTVLARPYDEAPVSNLYLFGRKEDLAFEQSVGDDPRRRHHVRFWRAEQPAQDGRPVWLGAATYDERVGLSHTTGEITHHIASDVDAEREHLIRSLKQTGNLSDLYYVDDFHQMREGKNGGGDPWHTDGRLAVGGIAESP